MFVQALVSDALMFLAVRQVLNSLAVRQPRGILGRYLKGDLETKQSICACVVLNMGAKLSFNWNYYSDGKMNSGVLDSLEYTASSTQFITNKNVFIAIKNSL